MNSCLADLSRLIPPQYQRKSRGRIEKTEIIEMAIKHIKTIQNKEHESRQSFHVDQYREGYHECLATAVQFLIEISTHFEDICFKMVNHLKEHYNDAVKGDHCTSSSSTYGSGGGGGIAGPPAKRSSPPTLNVGLGHILFNGQANNGLNGSGGGGGGLNGSGGGGGGTTNQSIAVAAAAAAASALNGASRGLLHLCGTGSGHGSGAGEAASSSEPEMNCAKDLTCRSSTASGASTGGKYEHRSGGGGGNNHHHHHHHHPQQTPVITSTASSCSVQSSSNVDVNVETESSSLSAMDHGCVMEVTTEEKLGGGCPSGSSDRSLLEGQALNAAATKAMLSKQSRQQLKHQLHQEHLQQQQQQQQQENHHHHHLQQQQQQHQHQVTVHNLTDTSCDAADHHNHYKFKNYIQQRFSQDEHIVSNSSNEMPDCAIRLPIGKQIPVPPDPADSNSSAEDVHTNNRFAFNNKANHFNTNNNNANINQNGIGGGIAARKRAILATIPGIASEHIKEELGVFADIDEGVAGVGDEDGGGKGIGAASSTATTMDVADRQQQQMSMTTTTSGSGPKSKLSRNSGSRMVPVPIFALHSQGSFYIPLTIDYEALLPFLGADCNLLEKNVASIKALHPISINIYTPF